MAVAPNVLASSASTSSFVMLSNKLISSGTNSPDDSDDEIVYSVSGDSFLSFNAASASDSTASDDDFVVLSRSRSRSAVSQTGCSTPNGEDDDRAHTPSLPRLTADLEKLTIKDNTPSRKGPRQRKAKNVSKPPNVSGSSAKMKSKTKSAARPSVQEAAASYPSPVPSPARPKHASAASSASIQQEKIVVKVASKKSKKNKTTGLGTRSVVDDASERFSEDGEVEPGSPSKYEEAVGYITSFLSNPAARKNSACRLTLLQALIIELGLASSTLPASLTSAKAFLKSRVFLNIREYLAVREQGPAAVQRIMHSSRNSLIKDIRKNKDKAPLGWVKDSGLQVLLVHCHN